MAYIYGIKNRINEKWYIGQSIYFPKERFLQRIRDYTRVKI